MAARRKVEVFSAGCAICDEAVATVQRLASSSCDVKVLDLRDEQVASRARTLGIRSVPAVVIDGQLARCCAGQGVDEEALRAAGIDQS
ncbi:thioredoxin family protein [Burkholderia aenigmatica]|uniref:thioredoxin family protein n=1 Tax=Burkholderia aenigmatica TaxID=2015348 RepID=UPI0026566E05|nr:thioredoxin family protein [Burkholderia aenigmatica]MDN7876567.1 thioredoxin family protein [Burkholderia aenigmatica]